LPGRWNDAGVQPIENDVSDVPTTRSGKSPARVRLAKVAIPTLLTAGALLGYISVEMDRGAPVERSAAPAPTAPEPVQDVVSASEADAAPEPPLPSSEPMTVEPAAEIAPTDIGLDRLRTALGTIRCAVLHADVVDGTLAVSGTVTSDDDHVRVQQLLDALPAGVARASTITVAPPVLCEPLIVLEPLRAANGFLGTPLAVMLAHGDGVFASGQDLLLDIRAPDFPAYLQVDYFTVDGGVVHLLPNPLDPAAKVEPGTVRRLGERTGRTHFWTIGPPFGRELIVVIASAAPLFAAPRMEAEPAAIYLPDLKRALDGLDANGPQPVASALFITTRAP